MYTSECQKWLGSWWRSKDYRLKRVFFGKKLGIVGSCTCRQEGFLCILFFLSVCSSGLFQRSHLSQIGHRKQCPTPFQGWPWMVGAVRILEEVTLGTEARPLGVLSPPRTFACSVILCCFVFCFNEGNYSFIVPQTLLLELPASEMGCWVKRADF